ncbi:hypothetical protein LRD69_13215 [Streptomyces sp. JH14]|uniref:hypothetical protein n=1 Tax=Streptomyces sp. JH14 TaxID=2793630 RepID=UPI0023F7914A|nr:hypothetical protein [Streptomyces sp. JH14]MDF6043093.1 hypothetical protein [Streptomyces sp. JH14]
MRVASSRPVGTAVCRARYPELEWSSGRDGTLRIDDGGKPFRASSVKARPQYSYVDEVAEWSAG